MSEHAHDKPAAHTSSYGGPDDQAKGAGTKNEKGGECNANERDKPKSSFLKKPWVRFVLVVVAIVLLVALILYFIHYESRGKYLQSTDDATIDALVARPTPLPLPLPLPPAAVAIGDPTDLLRRRPDIRAAERTLAQDTAKIGSAEALKFPSLSILGLIGIGGNKPADLTKLDNYTAIGAPMLSWNFLDFGRAEASVENAKGVRDKALAQYRMKVQSALQDAETSLSKYRYARANVAALARAAAATKVAADLDAQRFGGGTLSLVDLLKAQQTWYGAQQNLSQAKGQMTNDFVSLQKALGLGWSTPGCDVAARQCIASVPSPTRQGR